MAVLSILKRPLMRGHGSHVTARHHLNLGQRPKTRSNSLQGLFQGS